MKTKYIYLIISLILFIFINNATVNAVQLITLDEFNHLNDCNETLDTYINDYRTETNSNRLKQLRKCILFKNVFEEQILENNAHGMQEYKAYTGTVTRFHNSKLYFKEMGGSEQAKEFIVDINELPCKKYCQPNASITSLSRLFNQYVCKVHVLSQTVYQIDVLYQTLTGELVLVNNYTSIKVSWSPPDTLIQFKLYRNNNVIEDNFRVQYTDNSVKAYQEYQYQVYAHYNNAPREIASSTILINPYRKILQLLSRTETIPGSFEQPTNLKKAGELLTHYYVSIENYLRQKYSRNIVTLQEHIRNIKGLKKYYKILEDIEGLNTYEIGLYDKLLEAKRIAINEVLDVVIIKYYIVQLGQHKANSGYNKITQYIENNELSKAKNILNQISDKLKTILDSEKPIHIKNMLNNISFGDHALTTNDCATANNRYDEALEHSRSLPSSIKKVIRDHVNTKISVCNDDSSSTASGTSDETLESEDLTNSNDVNNIHGSQNINSDIDNSSTSNTFDSTNDNNTNDNNTNYNNTNYNNASGATHSTANTTDSSNLSDNDVKSIYKKILNKITNIKEYKDTKDSSWCNDIYKKIQWTRAHGSNAFCDLVNLFNVFMLYLENNNYSNYYSELLLSMIDLRKRFKQHHERIKYLCQGYKKIKQPDYFDQIIDIFNKVSKDSAYKGDNKVINFIRNFRLKNEWDNNFSNASFVMPQDFENIKGIKLLYIQPGSFQMELRKNKTLKINITKGFYISETEITVGQYNNLMVEKNRNEMQFKPVNNISFNDAEEYVKELNKITKSSKYRLPTEAELEYAFRKHLKNKNKLENNIKEWCLDSFMENYFEKIADLHKDFSDPTGPHKNRYHVLKTIKNCSQFKRESGSSNCSLVFINCKYNFPRKTTGFRIVRSK